MDYTLFFDGCAVAGGVCHIVCYLPQLYHMYRTRIGGALDPTYFFACLTGTIFEFAYLLYHEAFVAWVPLLMMVHLMLVFFISIALLDERHFTDHSYDDHYGRRLVFEVPYS
jgi:uncharacterized protein with PQ loop repeat